MYLSVRLLWYYLKGRNFIIFTDHKPLINAVTKNPDAMSSRHLRQLDYFPQFCINIRHISNFDNVISDMLSRLGFINVQSINLAIIAEDQIHHVELQGPLRMTKFPSV